MRELRVQKNAWSGFSALLLAVLAASVGEAQDGAIVYRLGKDTVAIERFSRSATRMTGEMVTRSGAAVLRTSYDMTLAGGWVTAATVKRMNADGAPLPNTPAEYRFAFAADSATRTLVFADSQPSRKFAAPNAFPSLPVFIYAPLELLRSARRDSAPAVGVAGNNVGLIALDKAGGDTLRLRAPGNYAMDLTFDATGRLQRGDGSYTTNKAIGTRVNTSVDIAAIAKTMKPTGVLSPRQTAYAAFAQGPITVNYGSPAVRDRSVWGGTLVPFDTVWRTGANEAAHFATSKNIQFGDLAVPPGLYTIWIQHTRAGTTLIINKQVGQWGTGYNAANDLGRVPLTLTATPSHVEDFTITIRPLPQARGAIDFAWGDRVATAQFTVRP